MPAGDCRRGAGVIAEPAEDRAEDRERDSSPDHEPERRRDQADNHADRPAHQVSKRRPPASGSTGGSETELSLLLRHKPRHRAPTEAQPVLAAVLRHLLGSVDEQDLGPIGAGDPSHQFAPVGPRLISMQDQGDRARELGAKARLVDLDPAPRLDERRRSPPASRARPRPETPPTRSRDWGAARRGRSRTDCRAVGVGRRSEPSPQVATVGDAPRLPREVVERAPQTDAAVLEPQRPAPQTMDLRRPGAADRRPRTPAPRRGGPRRASGGNALALALGLRRTRPRLGRGFAIGRSAGACSGCRSGSRPRRLLDRLDDDRPRGAGKRHCGFAPDSPATSSAATSRARTACGGSGPE